MENTHPGHFTICNHKEKCYSRPSMCHMDKAENQYHSASVVVNMLCIKHSPNARCWFMGCLVPLTKPVHAAHQAPTCSSSSHFHLCSSSFAPPREDSGTCLGCLQGREGFWGCPTSHVWRNSTTKVPWAQEAAHTPLPCWTRGLGQDCIHTMEHLALLFSCSIWCPGATIYSASDIQFKVLEIMWGLS